MALRAYITNSQDDTVSAISIPDNTLIATIPVGDNPFGVAYAIDGNSVWITNRGDNTVSRIDPVTNTVVATIPVGIEPVGIAITQDGQFVYVANRTSNTLTKITTSDNSTETIFLPIGGMPYGVSISTAGVGGPSDFVWVSNDNRTTDNLQDAIFKVAVSPLNTVTTLSVPAADYKMRGVGVTPNGDFIYIALFQIAAMFKIVKATDTVIAFASVPDANVGVVSDVDGTTIYVTNQDTNSVKQIDVITNLTLPLANVQNAPFGISITPDGILLYVANSGSDSVSVINTITTIVTSFSAGIGDTPIAFGLFIGNTFVCPLITLSPTELPDGETGVFYDSSVIASGGTAPYSYAVTGMLPPGLVLNPATGQISGTPTLSGSYPFTITATDSDGCMGSEDYVIVISSVVPPTPKKKRKAMGGVIASYYICIPKILFDQGLPTRIFVGTAGSFYAYSEDNINYCFTNILLKNPYYINSKIDVRQGWIVAWRDNSWRVTSAPK